MKKYEEYYQRLKDGSKEMPHKSQMLEIIIDKADKRVAMHDLISSLISVLCMFVLFFLMIESAAGASGAGITMTKGLTFFAKTGLIPFTVFFIVQYAVEIKLNKKNTQEEAV